MCNATTKFMSAALAAILTACSGGSKSNPARELYYQAEARLSTGDTPQVFALLDSIKNQYPDSVKLLRECMELRHKAMAVDITKEIALVDDSIAHCVETVNTLSPKLKKISDPRLVEPYFVAAEGYNPNFMASTGVQARVDEVGQFYLISSLNAAYKHTGITLSAGTESASAGPVPFDGEMNYRINGSEIIIFSPAQSAAIGEFAAAHPSTAMTLTFTGGKKHSVKLTARQVNAIATCYEYGTAMLTGRHLTYQREKLNRQLSLLSNSPE